MPKHRTALCWSTAPTTPVLCCAVVAGACGGGADRWRDPPPLPRGRGRCACCHGRPAQKAGPVALRAVIHLIGTTRGARTRPEHLSVGGEGVGAPHWLSPGFFVAAACGTEFHFSSPLHRWTDQRLKGLAAGGPGPGMLGDRVKGGRNMDQGPFVVSTQGRGRPAPSLTLLRERAL